MTIHILVEGPSERVFLDGWVMRSFPGQNFRVHPHQGKGKLPRQIDEKPDRKMRGLLDQLPAKLRGFSAALNPKSDGVLVLIDADDDDENLLQAEIINVATQCAPKLQVRVSVAIEEMEAFYLGDLKALKHAYPEANMSRARQYVPDSICGTWELFGDIVGDDGGNKVAWAEAMAPYLTTEAKKSRSPSFRALISNLEGLVPAPLIAPKRRPYRHIAKTEKK